MRCKLTDLILRVGMLALRPEEQGDLHGPSVHQISDEQPEAAQVGGDASDADHEDQDVSAISYLLALEGETSSYAVNIVQTEGEGFVRTHVFKHHGPNVTLKRIDMWLNSLENLLLLLLLGLLAHGLI